MREKDLAVKRQAGKISSGEKTWRGKDLAGKNCRGKDRLEKDRSSLNHRFNSINVDFYRFKFQSV